MRQDRAICSAVSGRSKEPAKASGGAAALDAKRELARKNGGGFYMIVGFRDLSEMICPEVMKALKDPAQFDHLGTLWGVEALNTVDVYRMRKAPVVPPPGG